MNKGDKRITGEFNNTGGILKMRDGNKDLDFLHEAAKKIAERSKEGSISTDEVFDLFNSTLDSMTDVRTVEVPVFLPVTIKKEDDMYTARSNVFRMCRGFGNSEEEATQKLQQEIEMYNKSMIATEKRMRIEEIVKSIFPDNYI